ncbi:hypothetical protein RB596_007852 [Gaeumannomyces avenae]
MFRAQGASPFDAVIAKATDENLTSEDWGAIMEVCDKVASEPEGSKEAVQALIKRLAHRNANVQLYTLEVANAVSQNCGKPMHRELASRAFTEALLKLANDRNTHNQVKAKILERTKDWSDMFKDDADLGIMYDAYYRLKQTNPQLQPPSAPQKNSLTDVDRQKEEEELQMALKLSLQEEERKKQVAAGPSGSGSGASAASGAQGGSGAAGSSAAGTAGQAGATAPLQQSQTGTTAATVSRVRALFDFVPSEDGELEFKKGDVIAVLESVYKDWWRGSLKGKTGIFPLNYVEKLADPTPDELQREAQMEAEVFSEIKTVEKLLTLLSTASKEEDSEEIAQKLYQQTSAIRPKLIKLIEKYSQKKDDFTQLNEKFIKARRDYEALLESSMSHPPQPSYHQYAPRPPQGYGAAPPAGYQPQGAPQQDPQRFYTGAPHQEQGHYPPSSPPPNLRRPSGTPGPGGAPFYVAGAEVPAAQAGPPPAQQFPPRDPGQRLPSAGKQPAPIQTQQPSSPPPHGTYASYSQPPTQQGSYGNPQELSTSVYDSPIASHNPNQTTIPPNASAYQAETYGRVSSPSTVPAPLGIGGGGQPQQQPYQYPAYSAPSQKPQSPGPNPTPQQNPYAGQGYDDSDAGASAPPPPQPTSAAPPPPIPGAGGPQRVYSPVHGGQGGDARFTLPSRMAPSAPPAAGEPHSQPQYKAYVPPSAGGPAAGASAPSDYYRQPGGVSY